jgi:hypothetical protein
LEDLNMTARKPPADDLGQAEVQKTVDHEEEQGFRGVKVDPRSDLDYSVQTGPDSPGHADNDHTRLAQHSAADIEGSK